MEPPLTRDGLVEALVAARHERNLSIRRAAALAKVPPSTAQGWFEGRHLPTPALMASFLELVQGLGLADSPEELERWHQVVTQLRSGVVIEEPPYVGLRSYTAQDAHLYVGRERAQGLLVEACVQALSPTAVSPRIVVVVGDSGSGKSSLLAAGLAGQACAEGGPLEGLSPVAMPVAVLADFSPPAEPTLLLVDQFEEAEQLDAAHQGRIFDVLAELPDSVLCVLAISAASFGFAMRDERLARHLRTPVLVGPLTSHEYRRIIEEPAQKHGREVDPALIDCLLQDLHQYGEPAPGTALPLLSSSMRRTWLEAEGLTLTLADYHATGGLWSALDDEAESVYLALDAPQREIGRRLILSMVRVDGDQILRRRIPLASLGPAEEEVAAGFVSARLLTRSHDELSISHDALLKRWQRLGVWVEEERTSLALARRIHMAAELWDDGGRHPEALLPVEAELWSATFDSASAPLLSPVEREFITASHQQATADQTRQREHVGRLRRRQNVAIVAALVSVALVLATGYFAVRSNGYRQEAEAATLTAQARQVALIADEVRPLVPNTAGQLSVAALALDDSVQTRSAVLKSAAVPMPTRVVGPTGNSMIAHEPAHGVILRGDSTGRITVWRDSDLMSQPVEVESGGNQLFTVAVTDLDGRALAFVGGQQTAAVWDVTGDPTKLAEFSDDDAESVAYSASWQDGVIHFGTLLGQIRRVDMTDPDQPRELPSLELGAEVAVRAVTTNAHWVAAGGRSGRIELYDHDGVRHDSLTIEGTAHSLDTSPDGREFLSGSAGENATLWSAGPTGPELLRTVALPGIAHSVAHFGDRLVVAGAFGEVREYDREFVLGARFPERSAVVSLDLLGGQVLAGGTGGSVTLWDPAREATVLTAPEGVGLYDITAGDDVLLIGSSAGGRIVEKIADGSWRELPVEAPPGDASYTYYYALSADGRVLVNQTSDGDLVTLDRDGDGYEARHSLPEQASIVDIRLSATGRFLAIGYRGEDGYELFRRDGRGWAPFGTVHSWPGGCAFSRDETTFAAMRHAGNGATLWDLTGAAPTHLGDAVLPQGVSATGMAFSPDGELAVGDGRGEVTIYSLEDPSTPTLLHSLREARSSLSQVGYSSDGLRLLAATREGQLWVWGVDGDDVTLDLQLTPGGAAVTGAAWYEDSLVMNMDNGRTVAWPDDPIAAAIGLCSRFGDPLTDDEWSRLVPGVAPTSGC